MRARCARLKPGPPLMPNPCSRSFPATSAGIQAGVQAAAHEPGIQLHTQVLAAGAAHGIELPQKSHKDTDVVAASGTISSCIGVPIP